MIQLNEKSDAMRCMDGIAWNESLYSKDLFINNNIINGVSRMCSIIIIRNDYVLIIADNFVVVFFLCSICVCYYNTIFV